MNPQTFLKLMLLLIVVVLTTTGCKFMSAFRDRSTSPIAEMPSVTNRDVDAVGRRLSSAGLTVVVRRPEADINADGKYGKDPIKLPEITRPFQPSRWNHIIAAQSPPPGTPLDKDSVITLTAGVHHGAGPFRVWLKAHGNSVKIRGDQRCRDCHPVEYCTYCHTNLHVSVTAP